MGASEKVVIPDLIVCFGDVGPTLFRLAYAAAAK